MEEYNSSQAEIEKLLERFFEDLSDFRKYCSEYLYIKDEEGNIIKFIINELQELVLQKIEEQLKAGKPIRLIILKCRQTGISTLIEAYLFWVTNREFNQKCLIIGHETKASQNLFDIYQRYLANLPAPLKPPIETHQQQKKIKYGESNNEVEVETAGANVDSQKAGTGRSGTFQYIHATECAFYPDYVTTFLGLLQASKKAKMLILETTANGYNDFRNDWIDAKNGITDYTPVFLSWTAFKSYTKPFESEIEKEILNKSIGINPRYNEYPGEEELLVKDFNCTPEQLHWRRWAIDNLCKGDVSKFHQEYPTTDAEAFLSSGRPVFDGKICNENLNECKDPIKVGNLEPVYDTLNSYYQIAISQGQTSYYDLKRFIKEVRLIENPKGYVKLFGKIDVEEGESNRYAGGCDVAEGLAQGDYSDIRYLDRKTKKIILTWHGHIHPDLLAEEQHKIQLFLKGKCYVNTEMNNHGLTTITNAYKLGVKQYYRETYRKGWEEGQGILGTKTTSQTKPFMINDLNEAIRDSIFEDGEKEFWQECLTFVRNERGQMSANGKDKDPSTKCFDDRVMAAALMIMCHLWMPNYYKKPVDTRSEWQRRQDRKLDNYTCAGV